MAVFSMILSLLSGVALFLFGMSLMGDGLKLVAGNKLEAFLYRMTNTPLKGVASWEQTSEPALQDGSCVCPTFRVPVVLQVFFLLQPFQQ